MIKILTRFIGEKRKFIFVTSAVIVLILTRFILIERSARFIWDESDDLVRMEEIFRNQRITLVGPMDGARIKIFGSLSYYMLMPFAALADFDPLGPVIGTAFYSVIIALLFALILNKKFHWSFATALLFVTFLFPLVQSGRWAWNPHYVPLWTLLSCALIIWNYKSRSLFVWSTAGFLQMLAIHNHWFAFFAFVGFFIAITTIAIKEKRFLISVYYGVGGFIAILPFIVFDLLRPPGLFLSRMLYFSPISTAENISIVSYLEKFMMNFWLFTEYFFQNSIVTVIMMVGILIYVFLVLKRTRHPFTAVFLLPVLFQFIGLGFITVPVSNYYFLPVVPVFILFIMMPQKDVLLIKYQRILLGAFFVLSIIPVFQEITKNTWQTNIKRTREITDIIEQHAEQYCNIYVAGSDDAGLTGKRYRDLLSLRGVKLLSAEEYGVSDCLFVVTTSSLEVLKKDAAYEIDFIRKRDPIHTWQVENWTVHQFVSWGE